MLVLIFAIISTVTLLGWGWLLLGRGMFWRTDQQLNPADNSIQDSVSKWPSVTIVIPARNEGRTLPWTLPTLIEQDYPGEFHICLVDDRSTDNTREIALKTAQEHNAADKLTVCDGEPLPAKWKGKVWGMQQGIQSSRGEDSEYVLFTDADIAHDPRVLFTLVSKSIAKQLDLVSVMATLKVKTTWDRLLVPAFVYFFAKLYPFRWINDPHRQTAGAAGGCVLVRRRSVEHAGGLVSIADKLIDDCALGKLIKASGGKIWIGFSSLVESIRSYESLGSIWNMVSRSAFEQLGHSSLALLGTVIGMLLIYLVPPVGTTLGIIGLSIAGTSATSLWLVLASLLSWSLMSASYLPTLRWYKLSFSLAPVLPISAILYTMMTVSSALRAWQGKGSEWKGRSYRSSDKRSVRPS